MNNSSFLGLTQNIALLLALVLIYDLLIGRERTFQFPYHKVTSGLLIGAIAIVIMLTPWVFTPGVIFDTRSVLLGISGMFFGAIPTIIAMVIAAAFRIYQGGGGALTGVLVIIATGSIGLVWHRFFRHPLEETGWKEIYLFGVLSHLVMLVLMFSLPWEIALRVLSDISLPVLVIYPLGTVLMGTLLVNRLKRERGALDLQKSEEQLRLNAVELRNSESLYRLLTENIKDVVWILDCETMYFRYISPSVERQCGFTAEEALAQPAWHALAPEDSANLIDLTRSRVENFRTGIESAGKFYTDEIEQVRKDGSTVWTEVITSFYINPENGHVESRGVTRDINKRKQAEEALHVKSQALNASLNAIAFADLDFLLTYVNPAFLKMWGYSDDSEVVGQNALNFWQTEENAVEVVVALRTYGSWVGEMTGRRNDGSDMIVQVSASQVLDIHGHPTCLQASFMDVTERKRAEAKINAAQVELRQMLAETERSRLALLSVVEDYREADERIRQLNRELERRVKDRTSQLSAANQELEAFSYSVSHDLRAPLRALEGFSSILLDDYSGQLDDQGLHYLNRIKEASRRMGQLINDLLDLSRVTRLEFTRQQVNFSALAQSIAFDLKTQAKQRHITFVIDPNMDVEADPNLIKIVMENMLNNAVKFTGKCEEAVIQVGVLEQAGEQIFFVRDNGAGFNMDYASKLFTPFQRLHGDQDFQGSGIGLSIVKRIITRHGGRIWPEAKVGQGTTFYFTLGANR